MSWRGRSAIAAVFVLASAGAAAAFDDVPAWMREAVGRASAPSDAAAAVLLDDERVTIGADGRVLTTHRYVARVVTVDGRDAAKLRETYVTDSGRIREVHGWVLGADGRARTLGGNAVLDAAVVGDDLYNEVRVRVITARDQADAGSVFAAEIVSEATAPFRQLEWDVDRVWPVVMARRTLTLPAGWTAASVTFNHAPIEPSVAGTTYVWDVSALDRIRDEPSAPPRTRLTPRLCVSYGPAAQVGFRDWQAVARWLSDISVSRAEVTPEIATAARQVVADATEPIEQARRIARFVQRLQYVSIQMGLSRGGGYQPRQAADVLARRYGDCKDKANLMRALLKAVGIESYLMTAFIGDAAFVRDEWPSPQHFNHCVIAIRLATADSGARVDHPRLGALMVFDATDPYTPLGSLPDSLSASRTLLVVDDAAPLVMLPRRESATPGTRRETTIVLTDAGAADVAQHDRYTAADAVRRRALFDQLGPERVSRAIESRTGAAAGGASQVRIDVSDGGAETTLRYGVQQYVRRVGALTLVKPTVVRDERLPDDALASRTTPIELEEQWTSETIAIQLPPGLRLDELPARVSLKTAFGEFDWSASDEGRRIVIARTLRTRGVTIAASDYGAVRAFVHAVRSADTAAIVLAQGAR